MAPEPIMLPIDESTKRTPEGSGAQLEVAGYQPYQGPKGASPSHLTVLWRQGVRQAWRSGWVRTGLVFAWIPVILVGGVLALQGMVALGGQGLDMVAEHRRWLRQVVAWQQGIAVYLVGIGAGVQAAHAPSDVADFFLARGVSARAYLGARWLAVATWVAAVLWLPALVVVAMVAMRADASVLLQELTVLLPLTASAFFVAASVAFGTVAVGLRWGGESRAYLVWWLLVLLPPAVLAMLRRVVRWPSLTVLSLPDSLSTVADACFTLMVEGGSLDWHKGRWLAALGFLIAWCGLAAFAAWRTVASPRTQGAA